MPTQSIDLGFSIADGEDVELVYSGHDLVLTFTDWREKRRRVVFSDTVAMRWQRADDTRPGETYDGANLVVDSPWLNQHRQQFEASIEHRHLKLNFNAAGCLEAICTKVILDENGS
jgi:hypothetical protein